MPDLAERDPARTGAGRDARSSGRTLAWSLLGGVVASLLPLPWGLAAGAFYVAAAVAAVLTLVRLARSAEGRRPLPLALVSAVLALSVLMLVGVVGQVLFYPLVSEVQTCQRTALTQSAKDRCDELVRDRLGEMLLTPTR